MEKTYVFDTAENGGLNSSALIASLMQNKGINLAQLILEEALYSIVEL